jgi:hypothetical protein
MKKAGRTRGKKSKPANTSKAVEHFIDTVESATYAEHNYFSERNPIWRRYVTKAPRLPTETDRVTKWTNTIFQPLLLNTFFGTQNKKVRGLVCQLHVYVHVITCNNMTM